MLNVGIVGTGMISESFVKAAHQLSEVKVIAIQSRTMESALEFAKLHQIEKAYDSYEAMLKDSDIDTVYIGLPNSLHFDYAIKALKAHKTTILEKPFLSNMKEYDIVMALSRENKTRVFEMNRVLQLPNFKVIQDHIKDIQPVRMITMNFSQYSRKYNDYLAGRILNVFSDEYSGGALVDLGVYAVHFLVGLFGSPKELTYIASLLPNTIDVGGNLILKYDGFIASVVQSKNSKCDNRICIQGEKGTIYVSPTASVLRKVELDTTEKKDITLPHDLDGMAYTLKDINTIIETNNEKEYQIRVEQSLKVMEVLVKARQSAGIVFTADK